MKLSVIIPIYNESKLLDVLLKRFETAIDCVSENDVEFLLINDGSTDDSLKTLCAFCETRPQFKCINLTRNHGHQLAITAGIYHAIGDAIAVIDGDLQDPPEFINTLYKKMQEGYDVVYAVREKRNGESFFKKATASVFYKLLSSVSSTSIPRNTGDFRIMSRRVVETFKQFPERQRFIRGLISWIGYKQTGILYTRDARYAGKTHYSFPKMCRLAWDAITSFSAIPLRMISYLGLITALSGFLFALYILYLKFNTTETIQGWTSLMMVVLILGGVQLLSLGVIGEYLGSIHTESKNRPLFMIEGIYESKS